ncbi:hypothetical protein AAC387_Pa02g3485 [Persea americana]
MVTLRKKARTLEIPANPKHGEENPSPKPSKDDSVSGYEQCRDERIKQNLQRMQNLGIFDLSSKLKSQSQPPKRPNKKTPEKKSPLINPLPPRRSSRLQSVTPVSYVEIHKVKAEKSLGDEKNLVREGREAEVYTEEHDKLLGTCEENWELFKDGYGDDGKRIYDPIKGKTCHQCRQKTLGHRTHCGKCNLVQGQFCGDCLYLRYGENVLETKKNPDWICPVCRGICNCSLCRLKKGWAPTGPLAKKVLDLGFKSVAHYLIQTRRSQPNSEDPIPDHPTLAKRSLAFTDKEDTSEQEKAQNCSSEMEAEGNKDDEFNGEKELLSPTLAKRSLSFMDMEDRSEQEKSPPRTLDLEPEDNKEEFDGVGKNESERDLYLEMAEEFESGPNSNSSGVDNAVPANEPKLGIEHQSKKKPTLTPIHNPDSIAGRLRKRPNRS